MQSTNILNVIFGAVTFGWIFEYLPPAIQAQSNIIGLKTVIAFLALLINGIALLELYNRGSSQIVK